MKIPLFILALLGLTAVILGALGSHLIPQIADAKQVASFQTALRFHWIHVLAGLTVCALVFAKKQFVFSDRLCLISWGGGILLFSGSIYWKTFLGNFPVSGITQTGGMLFMLGWLALAVSAVRVNFRENLK